MVNGRIALAEYWSNLFVQKPAGALETLQMDGDSVVISYEVPGGLVQALLTFDEDGKISRSKCSPALK
jgi:hypothetical protein